MYRWLFKNKWVAIAFVILTLASVQSLVGKNGKDESVISRTQSQLIAQRKQMQQQIDEMNAGQDGQDAIPGPPSDAETGFAADDELIDDAKGFDPTPEIEQPLDPSPDVDPSPDLDPAPIQDDSSQADTSYGGANY